MAGDVTRTENIKTRLDNGAIIQIQATPLGGQEKVASHGMPSFNEVTDSIEGIASSVLSALEKVKPTFASVEFGLEIGIESGQLTSLLVKGTGTANLKITISWGEDPASSGS